MAEKETTTRGMDDDTHSISVLRDRTGRRKECNLCHVGYCGSWPHVSVYK